MEPTFLILTIVAAAATGSCIFLTQRLKHTKKALDKMVAIDINLTNQFNMAMIEKGYAEEAILSEDPEQIKMIRFKIEKDRETLNKVFNTNQ